MIARAARGAPRVAVVERADAEQRQDRDAVDGGGQGRARPDARRRDRHEHHAGPDRDDERPEVQPAPHPRLEQRSAGPGRSRDEVTAPGTPGMPRAAQRRSSTRPRRRRLTTPWASRPALLALRAQALATPARPGGAAPARRGDARRQPPVGARGGLRRRQRRAPGGRGEDRRSARVVRGGGRGGRHALPALHRQPEQARGRAEPLLEIIADVVDELARPAHRGGCGSSGRWTCCRPDRAPARRGRARTAGRRGLELNVAVGYGGRQEIADAVASCCCARRGRARRSRSWPRSLDVDHIAENLYTSGQPDPDLVIRTSGEQRLSGFLLWQSAHSEFWFCEAYWPEFRQGRLPARAARLRRPAPPLRHLTRPFCFRRDRWRGARLLQRSRMTRTFARTG